MQISDHKCVGNTLITGKVIPELGLSCVFKNVCISRKELHYFSTHEPHVLVNGKKKPLMDAMSVRRTRVTRSDAVSMRLYNKSTTEFESGTFAYMSRSFVSNINLGHLIWEEFFPLFHTMQQWGIRRVRVLRDIPCHAIQERMRSKCKEYEKTFLHPFVKSVESLNSKTRCVETLLMGSPYNTVGPPYQDDTKYVFAHGFGKMSDMRTYVRRLQTQMGIVPPSHPYPEALLVHRRGRRQIVNIRSIAAHLQRAPWNPNSVRIIDWETMPIPKQLEVTSRCALVLTPPTGGNAHLVFMPSDSVLVMPTLFDKKNRTFALDAGLWSFVPHIRVRWYYTSHAEIVRGKHDNWKYNSLNLSVDRVVRFIQNM